MNKFIKFIICFCLTVSIATSPLAGALALSSDNDGLASLNTNRTNLTPAAIVTPTPLSPSVSTGDTTPTYTWTKLAGATQYQYLLYKGTTFYYSQIVSTSACGTTTCSHTPTSVLGYSSYSWKVRALISGVWNAYSAMKSFSVVTQTPKPVAPIGNITDTTPTYTWTKIAGATQYQYLLYKGTTFYYAKTISTSSCGTTTCIDTPTTILPLAGYSWKIRALVAGAWNPFSVLTAFTIKTPSIVIPTPLAPVGTIFNTTPTFSWTRITGATSYQYFLYKGTTFYYSKIVPQGACGATTCSNTPISILPSSIYSWKIRAQVGGVWKPLSVNKSFTVIKLGPGFSSTFTTNSLGWSSTWGTWTLNPGGFLTTNGVISNLASTKNVDYYATLTYEVKMKRFGACLNCGNYLIIRGSQLPLEPNTKDWNNSLKFQYTNDGYFSVWKTKNGVQMMIKDWTQSTSIIPNNWNILKVSASGSNMKFYINGALVWSGAVIAEPAGQVGIGMYSNTVDNALFVDWARLNPVVVASVNEPDLAEYAPVEELSGAGDGFVSP